jgi:hypothetical protein
MEETHPALGQHLRWFAEGTGIALLLSFAPVLFWAFVLVSGVLLIPLQALFGFQGWESVPLLVLDSVLAWALLRHLVARVLRGPLTQRVVLTAAWLWTVIPCASFSVLFALSGAD